MSKRPPQPPPLWQSALWLAQDAGHSIALAVPEAGLIVTVDLLSARPSRPAIDQWANAASLNGYMPPQATPLDDPPALVCVWQPRSGYSVTGAAEGFTLADARRCYVQNYADETAALLACKPAELLGKELPELLYLDAGYLPPLPSLPFRVVTLLGRPS